MGPWRILRKSLSWLHGQLEPTGHWLAISFPPFYRSTTSWVIVVVAEDRTKLWLDGGMKIRLAIGAHGHC